MKKFVTIITLLLITTAGFSQSKVEKKTQERTDEIEQVLSLTADEKEKVYTILLEKEKSIAELRVEMKDDKEGFKAEVKNLNKSANRKMKDFLGADRMDKMHSHFKQKRNSSKKK